MSKERAAQSGEERLIARYFAPLAKHPGALGLSDDAAAITPPAGCDLVLKTDGIVGGVHFFPDDPPEMVAKKALRVNLSDLAAKGATPIGFLLTLALPEEIGDAWLAPFARGLGADAQAFACPLLGGDTDRTAGPITISIAAVGAVPQGQMVRRAGAKAGDRVVVTGTIGDAALAKEPALIETILTGGDDYEIVACVPAGKVETLRQQASAAEVAVTEIGAVTAGQGTARFLDPDGRPLIFRQPSFSHF